jgi:hypothetical protein
MLPKAKTTEGKPYDGNKQFSGMGMQRSCGKCGKHKPATGFRVVRPWGMCCPECQPKAK